MISSSWFRLLNEILVSSAWSRKTTLTLFICGVPTVAPQHGFSGGLPAPAGTWKIETWLILPVVIRSSQRLSHACLSISVYTVKLRMAHYISYSLLDSALLHG